MKYAILLLTLITIFSSLAGCAVRPPTIAHTHVGHTLTGWPNTPGQKGLFPTAEDFANKALESAKNAAKENNDITSVKKHVAKVIWYTNPQSQPTDGGIQYGVKNALSMATHHLQFAATSPDASENIIASAKQFELSQKVVLERCDVISVLGETILTSKSLEEANVLTEQLLALTSANINGEDIDGDGKIGSDPSEYGLIHLNKELTLMIDNENPPYTVVDTWYLFNLVRQSDGTWVFRKFNAGSTNVGAAPY